MGLFWDLMQQSQISEHRDRADSLDGRVIRLERELHQTKSQLHGLIVILEKEFGKDFDGDGKIG